MGHSAFTHDEWREIKASFTEGKQQYMADVLSGVLDNAKKGNVAAVEWLDKRGYVKFPTQQVITDAKARAKVKQ